MHLFKVLAEGSSWGQNLTTGLESIHFVYFRRSNQSTDDMDCLKKEVSDEKQNSQRELRVYSQIVNTRQLTHVCVSSQK